MSKKWIYSSSLVIIGLSLLPCLTGCGSRNGTLYPVPTPTPTPTPVVISVSISPTSATMSINDSQTFSTSVVGSTNQSVTWSVQEGSTGGSITSTGGYTAPAVAGTYHVIATSVADSTVVGIATITVQAGGSAVALQ